jgi:hypothetical protein
MLNHISTQNGNRLLKERRMPKQKVCVFASEMALLKAWSSGNRSIPQSGSNSGEKLA